DKARAYQLDAIRACIGCNQSCIGRAHKGLPISCIQNPVSGRELTHGEVAAVKQAGNIVVIGGGPGGMKAAVTAAQRGHRVALYEATAQLGGQALLAQLLPGREEFGGIVTNLSSELTRAGVEVVTGSTMTLERIQALDPDAVIVATGAIPYVPQFDGRDESHVVTAWQVLRDETAIGTSVVIADWRADWVGLGLAERLALSGCSVTLCSNAAMAGESLQIYTRNHYVGRLHRLGVNSRTHARLYGVDGDSVYFQDTLTQEAMVFDGVDTVVLSLGHDAVGELRSQLVDSAFPVLSIGDCVTPRTAEEAVYEGFIAGREVLS
ncbi:MAG: FAD-dependent oxidoreductase, partial [Gammaproteobacteria bacterium]|nr:FAD-dependent oxidoreductase [Gammaproteobacteria bacterium]MDX2461889.1 FAD-dependent oxidoreductase [Gammaproteobacteria bacterium]